MHALDEAARRGTAAAPRPHAASTAASPTRTRTPESGFHALQRRAGNGATAEAVRRGHADPGAPGHAGRTAATRPGSPAAAVATAVQRAPRRSGGHAEAPARPVRTVTSRAAQRLRLAEAAVRYTKQAVPAAGNQYTALSQTGFASQIRMKVAQEAGFWDFSRVEGRPDLELLLAATSANVAGGTCRQYADIALDHLRVHAPGEVVRKVEVAGVDHVFTVIGDERDPDHEWVVADAWPQHGRACLWDDYFMYTPHDSDLRIRRRVVADGRSDINLLRSQVSLNRAGQHVTGWDVGEFGRRGLNRIAEDLLHYRIDLGRRSPISVHTVLDGLEEFADTVSLRDAAQWSRRKLDLWCASQVDRSVLLRVLQDGSAGPGTLEGGINDARAEGRMGWVWDQRTSTAPGRDHDYAL